MPVDRPRGRRDGRIGERFTGTQAVRDYISIVDASTVWPFAAAVAEHRDIVDIPESPLDPATASPVWACLWADSPGRAFVERTSAAIMVLRVLAPRER